MIKGSVLKTFDETYDGAPIICCHARERLCNFNCVKALIVYILPHLDNTIFNRTSQMRSLSFEAKLHNLKTFSKFYG